MNLVCIVTKTMHVFPLFVFWILGLIIKTFWIELKSVLMIDVKIYSRDMSMYLKKEKAFIKTNKLSCHEFYPQVSNRRSVSSDSTFGLLRDLWRVPEQTGRKTSTIWCQNWAPWFTGLGLLNCFFILKFWQLNVNLHWKAEFLTSVKSSRGKW